MIFRGKSIATGALLQAEQIRRLAAFRPARCTTAARRAAAVRDRTADWLVGYEHSSARPNGVAHGFRSNPDLHVWRGDWFARPLNCLEALRKGHSYQGACVVHKTQVLARRSHARAGGIC